MKLDRTGIILFVDKYDECVSFYRDIIKLPVLFQKEDLTCFEFGGSYLMIEPQENESFTNKEVVKDKNQICLRFNVSNIKLHCEKLLSLEIPIKIEEYEWGTVARFKDPDGNNCSLKDSEKFELQIKDFKNNHDT